MEHPSASAPRYFNYRHFLLFLGWTAATIWYFFLVVAREDLGTANRRATATWTRWIRRGRRLMREFWCPRHAFVYSVLGGLTVLESRPHSETLLPSFHPNRVRVR